MSKIENIDELISKYLSGNALPEEAILLEDWRSEHPENDQYFLECEKVFLTAHYSEARDGINEKVAWDKILKNIQAEEKPISIQPRKLTYLRIAAFFAIAIGIYFVTAYLSGSREETDTLYTSTDQLKLIKLNDNTEVSLSKHSKLIVDKFFGYKNRTVHLKGSADFDITHKDSLPFIVDAGHVYIKDIGTKFSVRLSLDTDTIYVKVDEGVVLLFDSLGSELEIKASQKAIYIHSKKQLINLTDTNSQNMQFDFRNEMLINVVDQLSKSYHVEIILDNPELKQCKITSQFIGEDIETIMNVVTETLGLSWEKTANGYLIKGQKCQS